MELATPFYDVLTFKSILIRIIASLLIGGVIGYERGRHNKNAAGFRTHILVCLGATIVSTTQDQLRVNIYNFTVAYPIASQIIKTDLGRIGAQVVSGIGFLGAGAIMRDKGMIGGLTTAASIWVTGCLGLAIGWGFYSLAIPCAIAIIIVLVTLKKIEMKYIDNKAITKLNINLKNDCNYTQALLGIYQVFQKSGVVVKKLKKNDVEKNVVYTLIVPKNLDIMEMMLELSKEEYISQIQIP